MVLEDYKSFITEMVKNPDNLPIAANELLEKLSEDFNAFESLKTETEEKDKKIRSLQDTNIKLFLNSTSSKIAENEEEEELTGEAFMNKYVKEMLGGNK